MVGGTALDRARIEQAFRIMGQYLLDHKALGEIAIYGGSAILFQFDWRRTSDVERELPAPAELRLQDIAQALRSKPSG